MRWKLFDRNPVGWECTQVIKVQGQKTAEIIKSYFIGILSKLTFWKIFVKLEKDNIKLQGCSNY